MIASVATRLGLAKKSAEEARYSGLVELPGVEGSPEVRLALVEETIDVAHHPEFSDLFQRHGGAKMPFARLTVILPARVPVESCFQILRTTPDTIEIGAKESIAVMDGRTRTILRLGDAFGVFEDHLRFDALLTARRTWDLESAIRSMCEFGLAISNPGWNRLDRLVELATQDPVPEARARAVDAILSSDASPELTTRIAEAALLDDEAEVQFAAAKRLGARGFDTVERIATSGASDTLPAHEAVRERAFVHAARSFGTQRAQAVLLMGLQDPSWTIQFTILSELAERRFRGAVPVLLRSLPRIKAPALSRYAETLAELKDASSQPVLLDILAKAPLEARIAAIDALGRVGSRTALPSLHKAVTFSASRDLRLAVATAIELIRARSGETRVGGLTISGVEGLGTLAIAPSEGDLSVTEDKSGE